MGDLTFTLNNDVFDGELGGVLDTDPFNLGEPQSGYLKSAVKEAAKAAGEPERGLVAVDVSVTGKVITVKVDAGASIAPSPAIPQGTPAPAATPEEIKRSQATVPGNVFYGSSGPIEVGAPVGDTTSWTNLEPVPTDHPEDTIEPAKLGTGDGSEWPNNEPVDPAIDNTLAAQPVEAETPALSTLPVVEPESVPDVPNQDPAAADESAA